jgi:hypothetical protein
MSNEDNKLVEKWGYFIPFPEELKDMWTEIGTDGIALFLFLMSMVNRERGDDQVWPSYNYIREHTGLSNRRIRRGQQALIDSGWLKVKKRFSNSVVYTLTRPQTSHSDKNESVHVSQGENNEDASPLKMDPQSSQNDTTFLSERQTSIEELNPDILNPEGKDPLFSQGENSDTPPYQLLLSLYQVLHVSEELAPEKLRDNVVKLAEDLLDLGATEEEVLAKYGDGGWWYTSHWRGQKGSLPSIPFIRETWAQADYQPPKVEEERSWTDYMLNECPKCRGHIGSGSPGVSFCSKCGTFKNDGTHVSPSSDLYSWRHDKFPPEEQIKYPLPDK